MAHKKSMKMKNGPQKEKPKFVLEFGEHGELLVNGQQVPLVGE